MTVQTGTFTLVLNAVSNSANFKQDPAFYFGLAKYKIVFNMFLNIYQD